MRELAWVSGVLLVVACGGGGGTAPGGGDADGSGGGDTGEEEGSTSDGSLGQTETSNGTQTTGAGTGETGEPEPGCEDAIAPEARGCDEAVAHPDCDGVLDLAINEEAAALYAYAGRFTRGDAPVYRGTVSASTTTPNQEPASGDVLAPVTLEEHDGVGGGFEHRLNLFYAASEQQVRIRQHEENPTTTVLGPPQDLGTIGGFSGECVGCLLDLATAPAEFAININAAGDEAQLEASGNLEQTDPADLTLTDIQLLGWVDSIANIRIRNASSLSDGELSVTLDREVRVQVPSTPGNDTCHEVTRYTARWFIDEECPARHGVTDIEITQRLMCCWPDTKDPGDEDCSEL